MSHRYPHAKRSRLIVATVLIWILERFNFHYFLDYERLILEKERADDSWFAGMCDSKAERRKGLKLIGQVYQIFLRERAESKSLWDKLGKCPLCGSSHLVVNTTNPPTAICFGCFKESEIL